MSEGPTPVIEAFLAATGPWKTVAHELADAAAAALGQPQDEDTARDLTALRDALLVALVRVEVLVLILAEDDAGQPAAMSEPDVGEAMRRADAHPRVSGWGIWFLAPGRFQGMVTLRPDGRPLSAEGSTAAGALLAALAMIDDEDEPS